MAAMLQDPSASGSNRASILGAGHFDRKNIAIVGNSVRIFEREDGHEIDDYQIVIRFVLAWPAIAGKLQRTGRCA